MAFILKKKNLLLNSVFVILCVVILAVLFNAPKETTAKLPLDENHLRYQEGMSKKEAEQHCGKCHSPSGQAPLPQSHRNKYRCLFCHKRQ